MKSKKKNKIKNLTDADYLNYINKIVYKNKKICNKNINYRQFEIKVL